MTESRFVGNLVKTLALLFVVLAVLVVGSTIGNELINSQDMVVVPFGFGVYLVVGIVEILLGYALYRTWRSK